MKKMPAIFIGHGIPTNAIQQNDYTETWRKIGEKYKPKAILMISAHWFTKGLLTQDNNQPEKINDMYGFPQELYDLTYPVYGDVSLTRAIKVAFGDGVTINNQWGIDHGAWSVLVHMYPNADVPVVQLSVDRTKNPKEQFDIGKKIANLREQGYMIIASGNVVHNLRKINPALTGPYPWASAFDDYIENAIRSNDYNKCIDYLSFGEPAQLSVPMPDHFFPLLNLLGAVDEEDQLTIFNKGYELGCLSMTGYLFE